jgi:hypothetical protein
MMGILRRIRKFTAVLPVLGLLVAVLWVPRTARANSSFLETIGISVAVGTVLGASTLPFYSQPGTHVKNVAYGASAGALVGVGILVAGLFQGSDDETAWRGRNIPRVPENLFPQTQAWTPLVSLTW